MGTQGRLQRQREELINTVDLEDQEAFSEALGEYEENLLAEINRKHIGALEQLDIDLTELVPR